MQNIDSELWSPSASFPMKHIYFFFPDSYKIYVFSSFIKQIVLIFNLKCPQYISLSICDSINIHNIKTEALIEWQYIVIWHENHDHNLFNKCIWCAFNIIPHIWYHLQSIKTCNMIYWFYVYMHFLFYMVVFPK